MDRRSSYFRQALAKVKIIGNDIIIGIPSTLLRSVLERYHIYLNRPVGSIFAKIIQEFCYCKGLVTQANLYSKTVKIFQQFKKRKTIYENLPPKIISELKNVRFGACGPDRSIYKVYKTTAYGRHYH